MAHRFTLSVLLDICDKFDLWVWITIDSLEHATSFTGLSQAQLAAKNTQNREYTACFQSHRTFKSHDGFQQLWRSFFSHNSFEGTPALRRSSRRKSFGWNAAEKNIHTMSFGHIDLASWLERIPNLFCQIYRGKGTSGSRVESKSIISYMSAIFVPIQKPTIHLCIHKKSDMSSDCLVKSGIPLASSSSPSHHQIC